MPYINAISFAFTRPVSTLLRYDGTEYPGGTIANKVRIPHERSLNEVFERADNSTSFSEIGNRVGRMGGFELDVFREEAVAAIMSDVGRAATEGLFILEMPGPRYDSSVPGKRYFIRLPMAEGGVEFEPVGIQRSVQRIQWHRADLTGTSIEVARTETFSSVSLGFG